MLRLRLIHSKLENLSLESNVLYRVYENEQQKIYLSETDDKRVFRFQLMFMTMNDLTSKDKLELMRDRGRLDDHDFRATFIHRTRRIGITVT